MATGETEFGGAAGLVPKGVYSNGTENVQQQVWEVYATNPSGLGSDADPTQQAPLGRVGRKPPRETYTPHWGNGGL